MPNLASGAHRFTPTSGAGYLNPAVIIGINTINPKHFIDALSGSIVPLSNGYDRLKVNCKGVDDVNYLFFIQSCGHGWLLSGWSMADSIHIDRIVVK